MSSITPEAVQHAKAQVRTCSVEEAAQRLAEEPNPLLIDVREPDEHARGTIPGAALVPRGSLETEIAGLCADLERPILIHCAAGGRAALAALALQERGYANVTAVDGRFDELARLCQEAGS